MITLQLLHSKTAILALYIHAKSRLLVIWTNAAGQRSGAEGFEDNNGFFVEKVILMAVHVHLAEMMEWQGISNGICSTDCW
jgi:hypothetical protein